MSDNDDQSNIEMILKALEYDQSLQAGSSSTHNMIYGDRDIVAERLVADYFGENSDPSKYSDYYLRRRYRTRRKLFLEIEWVNCTKAWHGQFERGDKKTDQDKDCLIIDRINNGQWSWNWSRTNLGVRNLAYLCDMLNEIGQLNIDVNEDTCTWSLGPNGTFTVKDARYRIDQNILPILAHATTWDKSIPQKVNMFMWRLSLDRLCNTPKNVSQWKYVRGRYFIIQ
ncbi:hypothetical protein Tco_0725934 [Tanacetum coccineum]|uniref:Reverse transcriptase zinc-binding domain-containing protein n=1 Tax=Tanacetum coccineum TaxID=301880 RepID=A0ABQ4YGH2_9ASTR